MQLGKICDLVLCNRKGRMMRSPLMHSAYESRMIRVMDYIHDNPAGDLSLDRLADVAAMSRFHWHRIYQAMTGETCAETVRRIRLHRAACWLVQTDWPLARVAASAGYPNPRSFARAFGDHYGATPTQFRNRGDLSPSKPRAFTGGSAMFMVEITTQPDRRMIVLPHKGPYQEISRAFQKLSAKISARGLWPRTGGMVAVFHDDVSTAPAANLSSHAGFFLTEGTVLPDDLPEMRLPGGPVAVLHYKGPYAGLMAGYRQLYGQWLPASGHEAADAPPYEVYLNSPMEVAPDDLLTDICLPLK
jgi:AraC family transcriptional regulator